ncbi:relaxase/mobilization nuclease domain-containing protein [Rhodocytophaga aerolata]|uniref:Relaxase/mobilization nuclease domain-containing protein n=1 Tax=Rhodocytophaga aerolata TaxID=455078 RepID=A0ABT8RHF1_9BACT|nr:relaxase/mobilization nuclease domain-containing protein [Rhodocytophaga aerolata]MDO1451521.1 relaxase/mobilization nuclease domain-containing protein [Rhodocytophaga aerolata]
MIGRGKTIRHAGNALVYAKTKLGAQEIDRQYIRGHSPKEIEAEFKLFGDMNTRCEKNILAFVISPTIEDGKKLSLQDMQSITRDFIKGMNLEEHQYVAYSHHDKAHQHVHLYVNRIDLAGKAYKDSFLSNRASRLAEQIALNRGLTTAKQVQLQKQAEKKPMQEQVLKAHRAVLKQAPKDVEQYSQLMRERGLGVVLKRNKEGQLVGVQFELIDAASTGAKGEKIKASDVDRNLSGNRLASLLTENLKNVQTQQKLSTDNKSGLINKR